MLINLNQILYHAKLLSGIEGSIIAASKGSSVHTILVTSAHPGEGKTTAAVSLAYALSNQDKVNVLLIDASHPNPKLGELFNIESSSGLSNLVQEGKDVSGEIHQSSNSNLHILTFGSNSFEAVEVFRHAHFQPVLEKLKQRFDYIICDGPSTISTSEISLMAKHFDGIILVAQCERTKWEILDVAKERITASGGDLLGVILNRRKYYIPEAIYKHM